MLSAVRSTTRDAISIAMHLFTPFSFASASASFVTLCPYGEIADPPRLFSNAICDGTHPRVDLYISAASSIGDSAPVSAGAGAACTEFAASVTSRAIIFSSSLPSSATRSSSGVGLQPSLYCAT